MTIWPHLEEVISDTTGTLFHIKERRSLTGGDINNAYQVSDGNKNYFVKTNRKTQHFMFKAEKKGLMALKQTESIKVPEVVTDGIFKNDSYLVLSFEDMQGKPDSTLFGERLAQLHSHTEQRFGFDVDNTIGSTPQINAWSNDWIEFWQKHRLGYQVQLIKQNGLSHKLVDLGLMLVEKTPYFFNGYSPKASLLHGDLWSGNWSSLNNGEPIIYDPASYYGDHETDLAMTELFGHPGINFYHAYKNIFPINDGYAVRKLFYNTYHILNHANLFGGGYIQQSINTIEQLLGE